MISRIDSIASGITCWTKRVDKGPSTQADHFDKDISEINSASQSGVNHSNG